MLSKLKILMITCLSMSLLNACATKPDEIAPAYVSTYQFDDYTCDQLRREEHRITSGLNSAVSSQERKAEGDTAKVAVGAILFWPTLFFVKGDGVAADNIATLKGEAEALHQVLLKKDC